MVKSMQGEEPKKRSVQDLPISKESATKLKQKGITQAEHIVNVFEKCATKDEFCKWMLEECNTNYKDSEACYKAIRQNPSHWKTT